MSKGTLNKLIRGEKGQALMLVVILMLLGGLILAPLLAYMSTGIKVGKEVYEEKMELFYAADSGIQDALWQIKYEKLTELFGVGYDQYNYGDPYPYPDSFLVNAKDVDVTIENIWIPKDIPVPDPAEARLIIEGSETEPAKLIIAGTIPAELTYQIKIFYYYDDDEDPDGAGLRIETIGIWLPPGFDYAGDCSLANDPDTQPYSNPDVDGYCSGKAVVWDFASVPFINFPGAGGTSYPVERSFTFRFSGPAEQNPGTALSWVDTSGVPSVDYTWDADTKVYKIVSTATDDTFDPPKQTIVDAYTARSEIRELGSALSGDYCAVGNTLMTATDDLYYRDRLFKESSATVEGFVGEGEVPSGHIPVGAQIGAAFLYWSGWIEKAGGEVLFQDDCSSMTSWSKSGNDWRPSSGRFEGHHVGGEQDKYLTQVQSLDLSSYTSGTVTVSWDQYERWGDQLESSDGLDFAFSGNGGTTWSSNIPAFRDDIGSSPIRFSYTVPTQYWTNNFKMRFYLVGCSAWDEYVYIDNIGISVAEESPVKNAKVNRVIFNGNQITANLGDCQIAPNPESGAPDSWSYSCFYDVTDLVKPLIGEIEEAGDSVTFTLGHWLESGSEVYQLYNFNGTLDGTTGYPLATPAKKSGWSYPVRYQWTYAGWSLIIVYSSPETKGHQLYLFEDFRYIAPHTAGLEFPISGFLVPEPIEGEEYAAHLSCFVGDGDEHYSGDFIALNAPDVPGYQIPNTYKLWDGINCTDNSEGSPNNVWNSQSPELTASGIDIDTFYVTWDSGLLDPGDTAAEVTLSNANSNPSAAELINLVYIIISFRSSITSGGTISYLVRG